MPGMYIIAGLGNPGREYEKTRHNMGFMAVDRLAEKCGISVKRLKHRALIGEGRIGGQRALLVKPQVYMNNHVNDSDASELWQYFSTVIEWVRSKFITYNKANREFEC